MANFKTYRHKSYDGGLNTTSSSRELNRDEASTLQNWDITVRGRLTTRKGLTQSGNTQSNTIYRLGRHVKQNGSKYLLIQEGTNIDYLNGSTFTNIDTVATDESVWFENCIVEDKVYLSSENNVLSTWDGTTYSEAAASIPHGNVIVWFKNHMFALNNVNISGTKYPNRLYVSNFGDADTWTTGTDYIDMPGEGRLITANLLGDNMVIFKEDSYTFLSGYGLDSWKLTGDNYSLQNTDVGVGCIAPKGTVRVSANELWFIDDEGLIRRIGQTDYGYSSEVVSRKLESTIEGINKAQLSKTVAWTNDDKVYFAVPTGTSTVNNTVLVFDLKASKRSKGESWTTYTGWTVNDALVFETSNVPETVIADNDNKKVYRHTGTDDDGTDIDCRWDGKADDYDVPERYKKYAYGYIYGENLGDVDVTIHASVDGSSFGQLDTFNLQGSGSTLGPTGSFLLGPTGDNRLAGGEELEEKYYFADGGQGITGKTLGMSLRCSTDSQAYIYTFTNHFMERSLR